MNTILVIDDENVIINQLNVVVEDILESKYLWALNGTNGIAIAIENIPDLIITDYKMPDISGLDVIRALKKNEKTATIPIVMYSAFVADLDVDEIKKAGCSDILSKDLNLDEWIDIINKYLEVS